MKLKKAAAVYRKGCDAGDPLGCWGLGGMYRNGEGLRQDNDRAHDLLVKACNGKVGDACGVLGSSYEERGEKKPALEAFQRACKIGSSGGCRLFNFYSAQWAETAADKDRHRKQSAHIYYVERRWQGLATMSSH